MKDIYLMPKKENMFQISRRKLYLGDIYDIYPSSCEKDIKDILIRTYDTDEAYDVIHIGEVINEINKFNKNYNITFLIIDDIIIYFDLQKKDTTKYLRVFITSIIVFIGSIMGIMNFHADVNMLDSQFNMVSAISNNPRKYLGYFQIAYTIGVGVGVSLFFNKFIPNYSKDEPSPLDIKMSSLNKEMEGYLKKSKR